MCPDQKEQRYEQCKNTPVTDADYGYRQRKGVRSALVAGQPLLPGCLGRILKMIEHENQAHDNSLSQRAPLSDGREKPVQSNHYPSRSKTFMHCRQRRQKEQQAENVLSSQHKAILSYANVANGSRQALPGGCQGEQQGNRQKQPAGPANEQEGPPSGEQHDERQYDKRKQGQRDRRKALQQSHKNTPGK
jgi:hypothetical protein